MSHAETTTCFSRCEWWSANYISSAATEGEQFWHRTKLLRMAIQAFLVDRIWVFFPYFTMYAGLLLQIQKYSFGFFFYFLATRNIQHWYMLGFVSPSLFWSVFLVDSHKRRCLCLLYLSKLRNFGFLKGRKIIWKDFDTIYRPVLCSAS